MLSPAAPPRARPASLSPTTPAPSIRPDPASAGHGDAARRRHTTAPQRQDAVPYTCFYFTVFFSNNPPIFHSTRLPPERLGTAADGATPSCPPPPRRRALFGEPDSDRLGRRGTADADVESSAGAAAASVGDYRTTTGVVEEVPQQTLQHVAFPTTFGSCGGTGVLPTRRLANRKRIGAAGAPSSTASLPPVTVSPSSSLPPPPRSPPPPLTRLPSVQDVDTDGVGGVGLTAWAMEKHSAAHGASASTTGTLALSGSSGNVTAATQQEDTAGEAATAAAGHIPDRHRTTFPALRLEDEEAEAAGAVTHTGAAPRQRHGYVRTRRARAPPAATATGTITRRASARTATAAAAAAAAAVAAAPPPPTSSMPVPRSTPPWTRSSVTAAMFPTSPTATAAATSSPASDATSAAAAAAAAASAATVAPSSPSGVAPVPPPAGAPTQEGPPWNMRVEEVRSAKGELRHYRIILTVAFSALVTTHLGLMHSLQTRHAAAALVLLCPPCGGHYRFLLHHVDVLRSVLHRTTEFAIRTVQRFFGIACSPTQRPKGSQQQVLRGIAGLLEAHPEALETYRAVKAELASALSLRFPLPPLTPSTSSWTVPVLLDSALVSSRALVGTYRSAAKSSGGPPRGGTTSSATSPLSDVLHDAAAFACEFSESFTSAFVCGLLSVTDGVVGGAGLRARRRPSSNSSVSIGCGGGAVAAGASPASPTTHGAALTPSCALSPTVEREGSFAGTGDAATTTHPASAAAAAAGGGATATAAPEWLTPYAAYWSSVSGTGGPLHSGHGDVIEFGKPTEVVLDGYGDGSTAGSSVGAYDDSDDDDAALTAHVSVSTLSTQTPIVSPLTIDVSASAGPPRSPTPQFLRGRGAATPAAAMPMPAPPTPTTAHLFLVSAETSFTSAVNMAASRTSAVVAAPVAAATVAAAPPPPPPLERATMAATATAAEDGGREDEYVLHRGRLGRVAIFTTDAVLARRLLLLAAYMWGGAGDATQQGRNTRAASAAAAADEAHRDEAAQRMCETAVAAAVSSVEYANVPIQWVAEEFTEARLSSLCCRFSPENTVLVVVPRQLQCRRVYLRKYVAGTTVLVEEHSGRGARIRSAPFPFHCAVARQVVVQPDPTVTTLLREARSLHESSSGTICFADTLRRMVSWLHWQSAAAVLSQEVHAQASSAAVTRAASTATATTMTAAAAAVGSEASLTRFASADVIWPSSTVSNDAARDYAGHGSCLTTPVIASPAMRLTRSAYAAARSPVCHRDASSWEPESVEEALLPGSMGGGAAAWTAAATAAAATTAARGGATPTTSTLLVSHGLVQPPAAFISASPTAATPVGTTSATSRKFFGWLRSSPTGRSPAARRSHPILSPTTLGRMYSADGGVGGQLPRLLAGDDDLDDRNSSVG
ncbi:hypothetical protein NESM_000416200 [Novymonas esmeraldas]|uniref:Uncharacterized protein n=1 Tax=Novymonas esmeraldas TaxID=1808958 RepID=A0AAW0ENR3_9TRYP